MRLISTGGKGGNGGENLGQADSSIRVVRSPSILPMNLMVERACPQQAESDVFHARRAAR